MKAGEVNAEHSHDWDARVMVIGGELTLTRGGKAEISMQVAVARSPPVRCMPNMSDRKASPISLDGAPPHETLANPKTTLRPDLRLADPTAFWAH